MGQKHKVVDVEAAGPWWGEGPSGGSPPCCMPCPLHTVFPWQLVPRRSDLAACRLLTQVEAGNIWSPWDTGATAGHRGPKGQVEVGGRWWHLSPGDPEPNGVAEGRGQLRGGSQSSPAQRPLPYLMTGCLHLQRRQFTGKGLNLQVSESQVGFKSQLLGSSSAFTCWSLSLPTCNKGSRRMNELLVPSKYLKTARYMLV